MSSNARTVTLVELQTAAQWAGINAEVIGTGGNVVALSMTVRGHAFLLSLGGDGYAEGETWGIGPDGDSIDALGDINSGEYPVTSDADQTIADALGWVALLFHGQRVEHSRTGDVGTRVGQAYCDAEGNAMGGVVWSDSPAEVAPAYFDGIRPTD